jgi:hypothetical protein
MSSVLITAILVLTVANLVGLCMVFEALRERLLLLQDDVSAIRIPPVPPNVVGGGRLPPSLADLQAARNRMDASGVAHPGGPG